MRLVAWISLWQTLRHEAANDVLRLVFRCGWQKEEVSRTAHDGQCPVNDVVGVADDVRPLLLSVYLRERDGWDAPRVNHVAQHATGSHTRQLVVVAYQYQMAAFGSGTEQRPHQQQVNHRRLIADDHLFADGVLFVARELPLLIFQQSVDSLRRSPRRLTHALGGSASRGTEHALQAVLLKHSEHSLQRRGLTRAWSSCQYHQPLTHSRGDGLALHLVILVGNQTTIHDASLSEPVNRQLLVQLLQSVGHLFLGFIHLGQIHLLVEYQVAVCDFLPDGVGHHVTCHVEHVPTCSLGGQRSDGQTAVAFHRCLFFQYIADARLDASRVFARDAESCRHLVSPPKAEAVYLRQPVGVILQHRGRTLSESVLDAFTHSWRHLQLAPEDGSGPALFLALATGLLHLWPELVNESRMQCQSLALTNAVDVVGDALVVRITQLFYGESPIPLCNLMRQHRADTSHPALHDICRNAFRRVSLRQRVVRHAVLGCDSRHSSFCFNSLIKGDWSHDSLKISDHGCPLD